MELGCQNPLLSSLWSKLPLELLSKIIAQTTDVETLDNWCDATQGSHHLHETATTTRWWTILDCEEWDDNAPAMTGSWGAPNVAEENGYLYEVSGKWKYTDNKHEKPLNAATLRELSQKLAHNQLEYWQKKQNNARRVTVHWKHYPPAAISLQAENIKPGKHILRGASNQVLLPGCTFEESPVQVPQAFSDLYRDAGALRYHGLHAEEVNGAERAHEGKEPFKGTMISTYETRLSYDPDVPPEARRACDRSCGKQIRLNGGVDVNEGCPEMGEEYDWVSDDEDSASYDPFD